MLDRTRKQQPATYALTPWKERTAGSSIRRRFSATRRPEKGPYSNIGSATLMIAREVAKEAVQRHTKKTQSRQPS